MSLIFGTALLLGWLTILLRREKVQLRMVLLGMLLGIPNVLSTLFMLGALRHLPGMVAFPVNSLGIMILSTLAGVLIWKEKAGRGMVAAMLLAVGAIVFINLG